MRATSTRRISGIFLPALFILCLSIPLSVFCDSKSAGQGTTESPCLTQLQAGRIETYVKQQMKKGKIPGMAVAIVKGEETVYSKGFGYADLENRLPVTSDTLFELGSCSKAFTGLAILQLEERGLLKLSDPVERYIPWLKMKYRGAPVSVTIGQFLYQTSGVPPETIGNIPQSDGDDALEEVVRNLEGIDLAHVPGQRFTYATLNYDVLGLVIQKISGQSFELYMKQHILTPLGLSRTYLFRDEARAAGLVTGYKLRFNKPTVYEAPVFRGNTPAGYVISNIEDMARWLKIQLGTVETGTVSREVIHKSHIPNPELKNAGYASGWYYSIRSGVAFHGGTNPNFSAFVGFGGDGLGVAILANTISSFAPHTGRGIMAILRDFEPEPTQGDFNLAVDAMAGKAVYVLSFFILLVVILMVVTTVKIVQEKRQFSIPGWKRTVGVITASLLLGILIYLLTLLPTLLGFKIPLKAAFVWSPFTFTYAVIAIFLTGLLYYFLYLILLFFPRKKN